MSDKIQGIINKFHVEWERIYEELTPHLQKKPFPLVEKEPEQRYPTRTIPLSQLERGHHNVGGRNARKRGIK